jgi:Spy/CpxP family protein refolding chaperone
MVRRTILMLTLALAVAAVGTGLTYAGDHGFNPGGRHPGSGMHLFARLTDEQRAAVWDTLEEMWKTGASPWEIHEAIGEKLSEYGVELPEYGDHHHGRGKRLFAGTTDEQRAEIREMVKEMRASGASPEQIHDAVRDKLREFGVERIELPNPPPPHPWGGLRIFAELSDEQRAEVWNMMEEMWNDGALPREIHEAVGDKLREFGVELPEQHRHHLKPHPRGFGRHLTDKLTDEQRAEIREMVKEMRASGESPEKIHGAVGDKLKEFGVELPEHPEPSE